MHGLNILHAFIFCMFLFFACYYFCMFFVVDYLAYYRKAQKLKKGFVIFMVIF